MGRLQGKLAVVTGGTTGIGFATAKRFVDEGAYVFITGRRQKELDEAVTTIGRGIAGIQGDVSKLQDLDRLYETVKAKGKIDVLVANAGIGEFAPLNAHGGAFRQALRSQREGHAIHGTKGLTPDE